jgi:hypothetical protein
VSDPSFLCATCGQKHPGLPKDYGFRLPDEVHALSYVDRYLRSRSNADLCTLDEAHHFLRGVLAVPLGEPDDQFCWGIWVVVSREYHDAYVRGFDDDLSSHRRFAGRLANDIPGYGGTLGLEVEVQFQSEGSRPSVYFPEDSTHALALEQRNGISHKRHHDILESVGFFKEKDGA